MKYIKDVWRTSEDGSVQDYHFSELNDERWNVRSVLQFEDGSYAYADDVTEKGGLKQGEAVGFGLAEKPWPEDGNYPSWVEPSIEITKDEFESVWQKALDYWSK